MRYVKSAGDGARPVKVSVDLSGIGGSALGLAGYLELLRDLQEKLEQPVMGANRERGLVSRDSGMRLVITWRDRAVNDRVSGGLLHRLMEAHDTDVEGRAEEILRDIQGFNRSAQGWARGREALELAVVPAASVGAGSVAAGAPVLAYQAAGRAKSAGEIGLLNLGPLIFQGAEALRWVAAGRGLENHPIVKILSGPQDARPVAATDVEAMLAGRVNRTLAIKTALWPSVRVGVGEFLNFVAWARRQTAVMA